MKFTYGCTVILTFIEWTKKDDLAWSAAADSLVKETFLDIQRKMEAERPPLHMVQKAAKTAVSCAIEEVCRSMRKRNKQWFDEQAISLHVGNYYDKPDDLLARITKLSDDMLSQEVEIALGYSGEDSRQLQIQFLHKFQRALRTCGQAVTLLHANMDNPEELGLVGGDAAVACMQLVTPLSQRLAYVKFMMEARHE